MSAACPNCQAGLAPKELKPGRYQPKCLKCGTAFVLDVEWKISAKGAPPHAPELPPTRLDPARVAPKPVDVSSATGDFTENADPQATGDFTEAEASAPRRYPGPDGPRLADRTDPNATGDFTEPGARAPTAGDDRDFEMTQVDDDVPPRLGGYEVLGVLGKGGMGAVLLGRQLSLDRKVALKVMHPKIASNPGFVARFTREAYAAAQLTHHNVVQIYDIGEDRGRHFFSMEFVPGRSLMEVVKKDGKLAPDAAVGYVLQAARGLRYGHHQGMVHRDIKPDNLMLNTEGLVKVADLGLVKIGNAELGMRNEDTPEEGPSDIPHSEFRNPHLTGVGAVMGTPAYMSPEQATDSGRVDQRADVYSLGCTLYVLVTGRPPFEGKTALEIISKHKLQPITPPEVVVKRVPKNLSVILLRMLAKRPDDRYQSMDEVIAALEGFLGLDRAGPFTPKEEQADQLEKFAHQFNYRSKGKLKGLLALGFLAACLLGVVGSAFAGLPALAGGLLGLMVMTPAAYFVAHGTLTGGVVSRKVRELVFGMRVFDWLLWAGGGVLFLVTLYLFGLLWYWLGFAVLAAVLGLVLWLVADRPQAKAREQPLEDARGLFKAMRLQGLEEDALRQFACKFSGSNWEPFYEALFGYEAKLAARAFRKGDTGEVSRKAGAWREPVVGWVDARMEARRQAKERKHLQKVEAKALEAEGVSKAEATARAAALAAELVGQAAEAKQARKEGKAADVKGMVAAARERRRPKPGYNLAGVKLRNLWFKDVLNDWLGRRLRFVLGAVIFAAGLLWMNQNGLLKDSKAVAAIQEGNLDAAQTAAKSEGEAAAKARTKPLHVAVLPAAVTEPVNSYAVPVTGLLLMLSGVFYFGWRPSLAAVPGAVVGVLGPSLGVPDADPLGAAELSAVIGALLIVVVARFLRQ